MAHGSMRSFRCIAVYLRSSELGVDLGIWCNDCELMDWIGNSADEHFRREHGERAHVQA